MKALVPLDILGSWSRGRGDRLPPTAGAFRLSSAVGRRGLRMLTRQKAEPLLGMKLTLFLSGDKNAGISCPRLALGGEQHS